MANICCGRYYYLRDILNIDDEALSPSYHDERGIGVVL